MKRESTISNRYEIIDYIESVYSSFIDTGVSMIGTSFYIQANKFIGGTI